MAVNSPDEAQTSSSGGLLGKIKKIKPGEWVLIGIGVLALVVTVILYQRNQANANSTTDASIPTSANAIPGGGSAGDPTGGGGTFGVDSNLAQELAAFLAYIQSLQTPNPPNTSPPFTPPATQVPPNLPPATQPGGGMAPPIAPTNQPPGQDPYNQQGPGSGGSNGNGGGVSIKPASQQNRYPVTQPTVQNPGPAVRRFNQGK